MRWSWHWIVHSLVVDAAVAVATMNWFVVGPRFVWSVRMKFPVVETVAAIATIDSWSNWFRLAGRWRKRSEQKGQGSNCVQVPSGGEPMLAKRNCCSRDWPHWDWCQHWRLHWIRCWGLFVDGRSEIQQTALINRLAGGCEKGRADIYLR